MWVTQLHLLTRFDLLHHRFVVVVLHLSYVQQGVGVPVVGAPVVHKHPRAAAATVHYNPIVQRGVEDVSGLHWLCNREVPGREPTFWSRYINTILEKLVCRHWYRFTSHTIFNALRDALVKTLQQRVSVKYLRLTCCNGPQAVAGGPIAASGWSQRWGEWRWWRGAAAAAASVWERSPGTAGTRCSTKRPAGRTKWSCAGRQQQQSLNTQVTTHIATNSTGSLHVFTLP